MQYDIETFSLTKIFTDLWGRNKVHAVDGLNLKIKHNEVFGLLGPNGSGKTTAIKMLLGLLYPTKGRYIVLGGDSADPKINARIGFMPEESYLYKYLSARETLNFYGRLFGLPRNIRKTRIEALLDMVGLKAVANRPVGTFSKGMARRIGLAQALINDPDLLILDEPTTGLDPVGTRQIKDLVLQLAKRGKTILLCSHLLADVEDVCNRIAILYGGRIQTEGKVKELLEQTDKKQIVTSRISDEAVEKIKQIVETEQAECVISSPMQKLETFFINTVSAAQQQAKTTSGAVSTTQIGDFLAYKDGEKGRREKILDKLVTASVSQERSISEPPATQPAKKSVQEPEAEQNDELLSKLAEKPVLVQPKPVARPETEQPKPLEKQRVEQDVLDQLTGYSKHNNVEEERPDNEEENPGNA